MTRWHKASSATLSMSTGRTKEQPPKKAWHLNISGHGNGTESKRNMSESKLGVLPLWKRA